MEFPQVSPDHTHHIFEGCPIYAKRFKKVGEFRFPGIAKVLDDSGAYHINFFGDALYDERYASVGDFFDDTAVVKDFNGNYFHIYDDGRIVGSEKYLWAGDFHEGIAVVYHKKYGAAHITNSGELLYGDWYFDAREFFEGKALVRDENGWLFVDKKGNAIARAKATSDNFPRGNVRFVQPDNIIPRVLSETKFDSAVILIRHAEREPFLKGEPGNSKMLTARGEKSAIDFGKAVPEIKASYSSPMTRCVRTAELIAGKNTPTTMLGDPGAFIFNNAMSHEFYVKNPTKTSILRYVKDGVLPGHYPIKEGAQRLFEFLKSVAEDGVVLCVTHDAFTAAFISETTGYDFTDDWVGFLEGCILFRRGDKWSIWWKGEETEL
ncbi:MAG: histidine phosphatase family protein [Methanocorpusculum sp.]|nr:histidine phosphatase family protein [Methanocorpusculum sp.]